MSYRPKVLVFIDWYAPGYKAGGPVRSMLNMVALLHGEIDFHIVTSDTEYTESDPYEGIISDTWTVGEFGEHIQYVSNQAHTKHNWKRLLEEQNWDCIYLNGMYSPWYSAAPLWFIRGQQKRVVVAPRGMLSSGPMKHSRFKKKLFLMAMRLAGAYKDVVFQATTDEEVDFIRKQLGRQTEVTVIPNLPKVVENDQVPDRVKEPDSLELISVARIAIEKNTHLAIRSLARVSGQVRYHLYGPIYDDDYWARCQEEISKLPETVSVLSHGPASPREIERHLLNAHALFMPSIGENFGHSMLEALSAGLPILISDRTPWHHLEDANAGWDLPLVPEVEATLEFGKKIQELVNMDQKRYNLWSSGAFNYACERLNSTESKKKYLDLFRWKEVK